MEPTFLQITYVFEKPFEAQLHAERGSIRSDCSEQWTVQRRFRESREQRMRRES